MTVYLVGDPAKGDKMDFEGFMAAYSQFFGTKEQPNLPARSTVQVAGLVAAGHAGRNRSPARQVIDAAEKKWASIPARPPPFPVNLLSERKDQLPVVVRAVDAERRERRITASPRRCRPPRTAPPGRSSLRLFGILSNTLVAPTVSDRLSIASNDTSRLVIGVTGISVRVRTVRIHGGASLVHFAAVVSYCADLP